MDPPTNPPPVLPSTEILDQMDQHMIEVAILRAALELQVWAKVASGEPTAEEIASREHWDPFGTRMLLDDLCAMKLLAKEGGRYRLVPEAESYLLPEKPTYMGRYLLAEDAWEGNGRLAQAIRSGKRPVGFGATATGAVDSWIGAYAQSWADPEAFLGRCAAMWQEMGIAARDGMQVLDIACGPAPKTLALARAHPGVRVTLLDWEQILGIACRVAAELGLQSQITALPGDLWSVPFPSDRFDLIYLGFVTHFFSPGQNARLFRKAYDALAPKGSLVVNAIRREYPEPTVPSLWFYAVSEGGAAYDFHEYEEMLRGAGFSDIVDVSTRPMKATKASPRNQRG